MTQMPMRTELKNTLERKCANLITIKELYEDTGNEGLLKMITDLETLIAQIDEQLRRA